MVRYRPFALGALSDYRRQMPLRREGSAMTVLTSRADVVTEAPDHYVRRLVALLRRKRPCATDGVSATVTFGDATARIQVRDGVLALTVTGTDPVDVAWAEDVLGRCLSRAGRAPVRWGRERG